MTLTLYGSPTSICTRRVLAVAAEAGLWDDVKLEIITDWKQLHSDEWMNAHHPFGQLPYLVDSEAGIEIFESRAIAKYLALKAKSPLVPPTSDPVAFARFETACSVEFADFESFATRITWELVFKKGWGFETDLKFAGLAAESLGHRLKGYDILLGQHRYLAGEKLTAVDLFHLPFGELLLQVDAAKGLVDGSLPNVARWWAEITTLPSWLKAKELWGENLPGWGWASYNEDAVNRLVQSAS